MQFQKVKKRDILPSLGTATVRHMDIVLVFTILFLAPPKPPRPLNPHVENLACLIIVFKHLMFKYLCDSLDMLNY